ncbi:hypothetical protein B0H17DRAFT_924065 [Mycena rosella]|uniref:Uncharacterized protein n=1 Tax=Mycena rosella TaxID=1033263 RepID=A0AAD7GR48_MYCRO|nr:hypothetical protein B0H17DRAFT_924065 [Mycena rosella]
MSTSSGVLCKHLYKHHLEAWVEGCDKLKYTIKAREAKQYVDEYRARKGGKTGTAPNPELDKNQQEFSQEAFVDALVEFIVGDDQSINVVENAQLRAIFLMLRAELKDSDIPHRTKIRNRIMEIWDEHLNTLQREMHLATAFLYIIDHIGIASKLGWVTLDNTSNNDTFMTFLETELRRQKIPFRKSERRIR